MKPNFPLIKALSVTTTIQLLVDSNPKRKALTVYNNGTAAVYVTSSKEGTTSTGIPIPAGMERYWGHFEPTGAYWIIGSGTDDVRVEETISEGVQ